GFSGGRSGLGNSKREKTPEEWGGEIVGIRTRQERSFCACPR
ncbi:hypothetical protein A2U01_0107605, partial [Trifolium medium]|nr:hypothetical protein [Trifolium medium]